MRYRSSTLTSKNRIFVILIGLLFSGVGFYLLNLSFDMLKTYKEKDETFISYEAVVVDYDYDESDGLAAIIVEYKVDGVVYKQVSNAYSSTPENLGTKVGIKYNPEDPNDFIWEKDGTNFFLPIISFAFFVGGVYTVIFGIRGKKPDEEQEDYNEIMNDGN